MIRKSLLLIGFISVCAFCACSGGAADNTPTSKEENSPSEANSATKSDSIIIYEYIGDQSKINQSYLEQIQESEKAILAYYCYLFNNGCTDTKNCLLTAALGLGEQHSTDHQQLVKKWFKDQETIDLVNYGGDAKPFGGEAFAWYSQLWLKHINDTIQVEYYSSWLSKDLHGKGKGTGKYLVKDGQIQIIERNHNELDIQ